jgi:drug/metabolite transporter (DMT)-like permease
MASVELIQAGMASLLFYTFPILVTLLAWALGQESLTLARLGAGAVCLVGVAALRPAEFVIFRIGQWTADQRPPG